MNGIDRLMDAMRRTPPRSYLSALSSTIVTRQMADCLMRMHRNGLPDEVINAITDYTLRRNGFRYIPGYAEKVADTLLARRTETAEEAFRFFSSLNRRKAERREEGPVQEVSHREVLEACYDLLGLGEIPKHPQLRPSDLSAGELDYLYSTFPFSAEHPGPDSEEESRRWDGIIERAESGKREKMKEEEPSRKERFLSAWEKGNIRYAEPRS